ncbi:protein argonaute-2-like [Dendronephthya gigantea]|uniref:protein argonaute-2-like n=1 Tax=Dendronephthya gigantea TaxID=151771 RepID=UPI00106A91E8|nr:protein argonaute-2-like [Dendronephthya gigantea]
MSEEQGGRGRGKKRGKGRRGKGRGRGGGQSESSAPGGLQQHGEEERGATALSVNDSRDRGAQTPKKHAERQEHGGTQPASQEHGRGPLGTASHTQPQQQHQKQQKRQPQKQQPKQPDTTDGGSPNKPGEDQPPLRAHGGATPKTTPVTPQQQPSKTPPPSQPAGKPQPQAAQPKIHAPQQPTGPPRSEKGELRPPLRPDKGGTVGRPIRLRVNFLPVQLPKNDIHHYDTSIKPNFKTNGDGYTKTEAPKIIESIVKQYETANPSGPKLVYDKDGKNMYCRTPIPGIGKDKREFKIKFITDTGKEREYTVAIQWAAQVSLYDLNEALEGRLTEIPRNTMQAIQTVLRFLPSMTNIPVGPSFFSFPDGNEMDLGLGLQMWNGRFVSIRPTQWKMMLNVDTSSTAFYKSQPVLHFMCDYLNLRNIPARLNKGQAKLFRKEMKTIKIETTHVKRKQRVSGLSERSAIESKFPLSGKMISVFDYFKTQYNITLKYPDLPCLKIGAKGNLLPMEVCNIMQGQRRQGKLTADQTREMIRHTAIPAPRRQQEIQRVIREAKYDQDPYCRDFGIKVGTEMVAVQGRVLEPPLLNYGPASQPTREKPKDGAWNMQNKAMFEPKELKEWALVSYENPQFFDERAIDNFINRLVMAGKEKHLLIHPSPCQKLIKRGYDGIGYLFGQLHKDYPNLQLIVVVFPGRGSTDEYYEEVKHYGDVEYGIRTQCVKSKNAKKADMQTMANICLKINAKLGGTTAVIDKGIRSPILKRPVIIFGADVTHPSPRDSTTPSIAAVVASMDSHPNLYSAEVRIQKHRLEIIAELKEMVVILLKKFRASTKVAPEKIIFYRDGVSEGQFRDVLIHELQAFQQACRELHRDYKPQITFIVVQKRHHARFFAEDTRDQRGKSKNVPAGTVVDTQVCHPYEFDWYLCSHAGIQGTSKPAHYHVLYDDSNFKSDDLQILTNQLCHTYVRCARSVSIPAPAYYAHHVAFRARYHLSEVDRGSSDGSSASGGEGVTLDKSKMIQAIKIHDKMNSTMYFA